MSESDELVVDLLSSVIESPGDPAPLVLRAALLDAGVDAFSPRVLLPLSEDEFLTMVLIRPGVNALPDAPFEITRPFWLSDAPITNGQWRAGVALAGGDPDDEPGDEPNDKHRPRVLVSWREAMEWAAALGLTLPTEAQWEHACRAGTTSRWSCGDDRSRLREFAVFGGRYDDGVPTVRSARPNPWGLFDMHGCAWEWCSDRWRAFEELLPRRPDAGLEEQSSLLVPAEQGQVDQDSGPDDPDEDRVIRGGSWFSTARYCESARRSRLGPAYRDSDLGFRVASVPDDQRRVFRGGCWYNAAGYCESAFRNWTAPATRNSALGFRVASVP